MGDTEPPPISRTPGEEGILGDSRQLPLDRDGVIPTAHVERLHEIGAWIEPRSSAIYGTRAGPLQPVDGVYGTTHSDERIFIFILRWPEDGAPVRLPALPGRIERARVLPAGEPLWEQSPTELCLWVDVPLRDSVATVIELECVAHVTSP